MNAVVSAFCVALGLSAPLVGHAAQSTAASVVGTVYDQQNAVLPGATVILKHLEIGSQREAVSDRTGNFRLVGLTPGRYEMTVRMVGFADDVRSDVLLGINHEAEFSVIMRLASQAATITVSPDAALGLTPTTTLGRTFSTKEIEELPVAARDFANLAVLTPGILTTAGSARAATGIVAAGQTGRNNTFLIDGLNLDEHVSGNIRGALSLETIQEFMVSSNSFNAEYGQASGAIISVLTRSGTNQLAGRLFYFRRDDAWDATPGAARLVTPPVEKTGLDLDDFGGFLGGPLVRNQAFYFGATELRRRDTEEIVTSRVLKDFRPNASSRLPVLERAAQAFGRLDVSLSTANSVTLRYRFDGASSNNQARDPGLPGLVAPERRADVTDRNYDVGLNDTHVFGRNGLNELRLQFARRYLNVDTGKYCPGCPAENRAGAILLGKSQVLPIERTEDRWQVANAVTWLLPDAVGDHSFKLGIDASAIGVETFNPAGFDGIFTFSGSASDLPFNPSEARTYPSRYLKNVGDASNDLPSRVYSVFVQDQWRPQATLTLNLGVRWDYEDALGISHDRDNVAPRLGIAFDPWKSGRTSFRGGYGVYHDLVFFLNPINADRNETVQQIIIANPGYPDPFGLNPNRQGPIRLGVPSSIGLAADNVTPFTEQASAGVRHARGPMMFTADVVWARGHNLLRSRDLNYPDLSFPGTPKPRPDPSVQRVNVRETKGNSWYEGLLIGIRKRHAASHSYAIAYTLSRSERDTEDFDFLAQDQRNYAAERGSSSNDVRHRLSASVNVDLPWGFRFSTVMTAQSASPYNITTGTDDNGDGELTDRPGIPRNSARGDDFWQIDARVSKTFKVGCCRIELLAESFNVANHRNWIDYTGTLTSSSYGQPTGATRPREIQLGVRVDF
jgi:hypothetical protein